MPKPPNITEFENSVPYLQNRESCSETEHGWETTKSLLKTSLRVSCLHLKPKQLGAQWMETEARGSPTSLREKQPTTQEKPDVSKKVFYQMFSQWQRTEKMRVALWFVLFPYSRGFCTNFDSRPATKLLMWQEKRQASPQKCLCDWLDLWVLVFYIVFDRSAQQQVNISLNIHQWSHEGLNLTFLSQNIKLTRSTLHLQQQQFYKSSSSKQNVQEVRRITI